MSEDGKAAEERLVKHSQHSALHYHVRQPYQGFDMLEPGVCGSGRECAAP
jgi:hypothetical protein